MRRILVYYLLSIVVFDAVLWILTFLVDEDIINAAIGCPIGVGLALGLWVMLNFDSRSGSWRD